MAIYLFKADKQYIEFQLFNTNIAVRCTFDHKDKHLSTNITVLRTFWA